MNLTELMREPALLERLSERDWDRIVPQAKVAGLLSRVATIAEAVGRLERVPERPRRHLRAAQLVAEKHRRDVLYELDRIREMIGSVLGRIVLLKGAAYLAAGLPAAHGRIFNDIDILVPEDRVGAVEAVLQLAGWSFGEIDPYDDSYYRRWMHQIPPMTHGGRNATIDVHHTIVPKTARTGHVDVAPLIARARPLEAHPGFAVLAPEDMIVHSATHLFNEGEFDRGLRDLSDLDLLLRHFSAAPEFWPTLLQRGETLGLGRPLFYALRHVARIAGTPVPREILAASGAFAPPAPALAVMDAALSRALVPPHASARDAWTGLALELLYVRAHYLRMPLHLLLPHLVRKAVHRRLEPYQKRPDRAKPA